MKRCVRCFNNEISDPWKTVCEDCWQWREDNPVLVPKQEPITSLAGGKSNGS